ncbi:hypothetical protein OGM63_20665 [Plectonema radiosum NIES-515]|uniref:Uncharacterized protein n=1 Tax=Plectonema radiosum NIES-515 TaxID=2986073 RepID=A0ABT3B3E5_9CYAN|nr:hypothetical protein [Plectonema radiosum]MCV3215891.1 hypothetical protein [Plectonema radiosum NIES-515]
MLLSTSDSKTPSLQHLVKIWAERYTVDVSSLSKNPKFYGELMKAALPEARALTASKLCNNVLYRTNSQAATQTKSLYEYIPEIIDSQLGQRINQVAAQVYQKTLEMYQQQSGLIVTPITRQITKENAYNQVSLSLSAIPNIEKLANELEPLLLKYQDQHITANDWRVVGFLTTLFNFSNKLLINQLTAAEKILLCPYFKFIEEEVALPWHRVCAAAAKHELGSPALNLVEEMFPVASEISSTVYCRLLQLFPDHRSRKGGLSDPDVAHSCLRDLDMFQAYLWLSVLEENIKPVEQELVPLCVMVMPSVGVKWEMIDKWKRLLIDEIESCVKLEHKLLLLDYTQGMEQAFFEARRRLGDRGEMIKIPSELGENLTFNFNS